MIPVPKTNELLRRLIPLFAERRPSELLLMKIRREASSLIRGNADPKAGHVILGLACALTFEIDEFFEHFRIAKQLSGDWVIRQNFSIACSRLGFLREAYDETKELARLYPDDLQMLELAYSMSINACQFKSVLSNAESLRRLGKPLSLDRSSVSPLNFEPIAKCAERLSVPPEGLLDRVQLAASLLRERQEPIFGIAYDFALEGRFGYSFCIDNIAEVCANYTFDIVDLLLDNFEETYEDLITIGCLKRRDELPASGFSELSEEFKQ